MIVHRLSSFVLLAVFSVALAGCAQDTQTAPQPAWPYVRMAPMAPPEPLQEDVVIPDEPSTFLWRPGYWLYNGQSFDWISGTIIQRPSSTAVWSQDHWIEHTYGWAFMPGYWQ